MRRISLLTLTIGMMILYACQREEIKIDDPDFENSTIGQSIIYQDTEMRPTVLGKRLENPYTVDIMKKALENIQKGITGGTKEMDVEIRATHLYVRILPVDTAELNMLEETEKLELFDHPLDFEILEPGQYYHEAGIPENNPSWKYTAVPIDYVFPAVRYQVPAELYLPDTDRDGDESSELNEFLDDLEDEALRLTGNLDEEEGDELSRHRRRRWNPSGQILVRNTFDNVYDGVEHAKARVRRWFTIKTAYTNRNGNFFIAHRFRRSVNYSVKYACNHVRVKGFGFWRLGPSLLNGPSMKARWVYRSNQGSRSYLWGTIFNATHDYHYRLAPGFGISPPQWHLRITARENGGLFFLPGIGGMSHNLHSMMNNYILTYPISWLFPDVIISGKNRMYEDLYPLVIHELGHSAHWMLLGANRRASWNQGCSEKMVLETWASTIEDVAHREKFGRPRFDPCFRGGRDALNADQYIRLLGRDLMDNVNEFIPGHLDCNVVDNVRGYTVREIFESLRVAETMGQWRNRLGRRRPNQRFWVNRYFEQWFPSGSYLPGVVCN